MNAFGTAGGCNTVSRYVERVGVQGRALISFFFFSLPVMHLITYYIRCLDLVDRQSPMTL